jgi:hypothetical protein
MLNLEAALSTQQVYTGLQIWLKFWDSLTSSLPTCIPFIESAYEKGE